MAENSAPWLDSDGKQIREGDLIVHPSGETGRVVFLPDEKELSDQWRVDYGDGVLSRLVLQVGEKGQAVREARPGELVLCGGGCGSMTPYTPPYPSDQCLCEKCNADIEEMMRDGTL